MTNIRLMAFGESPSRQSIIGEVIRYQRVWVERHLGCASHQISTFLNVGTSDSSQTFNFVGVAAKIVFQLG